MLVDSMPVGKPIERGQHPEVLLGVRSVARPRELGGYAIINNAGEPSDDRMML